MISSKADYKFYLEADKIALSNIENISYRDKYFYPNKVYYDVWKFQRLLRKLEYYTNCKAVEPKYKSIFSAPILNYLRWSFTRLSQRLGFIIPLNVFGPGLSIAYPGPIIVNGRAHVGENCRIHNNVHIASNAGAEPLVPRLGNNVFIGPGAVIVGDIEIADNVAIGANSFVNKSFLEEGVTIAGIPAKKVSNKGFDSYYRRSTDILRTKVVSKTKASPTKSPIWLKKFSIQLLIYIFSANYMLLPLEYV
jgi:serine O-acetyltransferase